MLVACHSRHFSLGAALGRSEITKTRSCHCTSRWAHSSSPRKPSSKQYTVAAAPPCVAGAGAQTYSASRGLSVLAAIADGKHHLSSAVGTDTSRSCDNGAGDSWDTAVPGHRAVADVICKGEQSSSSLSDEDVAEELLCSSASGSSTYEEQQHSKVQQAAGAAAAAALAVQAQPQQTAVTPVAHSRPRPRPRNLELHNSILTSTAPLHQQQAVFGVRLRAVVRSVASEEGSKVAHVQVIEVLDDPLPLKLLPAHLQAALEAAQASKKKGSRASSSKHVQKLLAVTGFTGWSGQSVRPGAELQLQGHWEHSSPLDWHIRVKTCLELTPTDPVGYLLDYLPGVGPATVQKVTDALGPDTTAVLDSETAVEQLSAIRGIGKLTASRIKDSWEKNKGLKYTEPDRWLQWQLGLPAHVCQNILKLYKTPDMAMAMMAQDPYALMWEVKGYSIRDAEHIACLVGFDTGAPQRAAAVLVYRLLHAANKEPETSVVWSRLEQDAQHYMCSSRAGPWPDGRSLRPGAELAIQSGYIVVEQVQEEQGGLYKFTEVTTDWPDDALVSLSIVHAMESAVINFLAEAAGLCQNKLGLLKRSSSNSNLLEIPSSIAAQITQIESQLSVASESVVILNEGQRQAVAMAMLLPVCGLTGGPGCGKTLTSQVIVRAWSSKRFQAVATAAPTGRAAQRLQDVGSAAPSSTIHRLLGYMSRDVLTCGVLTSKTADGPGSNLDIGRLCKHDRTSPLGWTKLLVDEVSMMDVPLAAALFDAWRLPYIKADVDEVGEDELDGDKEDVDEVAGFLNALRTMAARLEVNISKYVETTMMLVGDPDQLPPIGPGRPFAAALAAGLLPCVSLQQIFRTAAHSAIIKAAHAVKDGYMPSLTTWDVRPQSIAQDLAAHIAKVPRDADAQLQLPSDALFVRLHGGVRSESVAVAVQEVVQQLVAHLNWDVKGEDRKFDMALDLQVLSPTNKGDVGVASLNRTLQNLLNPPGDGKATIPVDPLDPTHLYPQPSGASSSTPTHWSSIGSADTQTGAAGTRDPAVWRVGDRVIHTVNDVQRNVYNGDVGTIESINMEGKERTLTVRYSARSSPEPESHPAVDPDGLFHRVRYSVQEAKDELKLAYAVTVHKAQGGEFPVVVMPLHKSIAPTLLNRRLLYTGISRAKQLLVIVGTEHALQCCVYTGTTSETGGWFCKRLKTAAAAAGVKPFPKLVFGPNGWIQ